MICCYESKMPSREIVNVKEYSGLQNKRNISILLEDDSTDSTSTSLKENSIENKLQCNQVSKTRLICKDRKNAYRLLAFRDNINGRLVQMVKRMIDFDPEMDEMIDSIVRYGESRTSVVKRVLSYAYTDSNFYNQK